MQVHDVNIIHKQHTIEQISSVDYSFLDMTTMGRGLRKVPNYLRDVICIVCWLLNLYCSRIYAVTLWVFVSELQTRLHVGHSHGVHGSKEVGLTVLNIHLTIAQKVADDRYLLQYLCCICCISNRIERWYLYIPTNNALTSVNKLLYIN